MPELSFLPALFCPTGVGGNPVSRDDGFEGQSGKAVKLHSRVQHYRFPSVSEAMLRNGRNFKSAKIRPICSVRKTQPC